MSSTHPPFAPPISEPPEVQAGRLDVRALRVVRSGREVSCGISLHVDPGEFVTLLGRNGAGKSTLLLAIAGLLPSAAGVVSLGDRSLTGVGPDRIRRAGVALVPEGHRVLESLDVQDNLRAAGTFLSTGALAAPIDFSLATLPELRRLWRFQAGTLSGGQKQMVAVAQALVADPRYLLIDELSLGLAPVVTQRLAEVLSDLAHSGIGILLVEQFTTLALSLASRAYILNRGCLTFDGPCTVLQDRPNLLHQAYLSDEANPADADRDAAGGRQDGRACLPLAPRRERADTPN